MKLTVFLSVILGVALAMGCKKDDDDKKKSNDDTKKQETVDDGKKSGNTDDVAKKTIVGIWQENDGDSVFEITTISVKRTSKCSNFKGTEYEVEVSTAASFTDSQLTIAEEKSESVDSPDGIGSCSSTLIKGDYSYTLVDENTLTLDYKIEKTYKRVE